MVASLRNQINELATSFATHVLDAIRHASLGDLGPETGHAPRLAGRPGRPRAAATAGAAASAPRAGGRRGGRRLQRRSAGQIGQVIDAIVGLLAKHPAGLRAEQIRAALRLQSKELPRPLREALEAGRITKTGEKRATTYRARGNAGGGGGGSSARASSRKATKSAKRAASRRGRPAKRANKTKATKGRKARKARRGGKRGKKK